MSINMRNGKTPVKDRISSLPCDVLEKILGCLPLRDAVQTSVLSREWRYKWAVRSELMFDDYVDKGRLLKTIIYQVLLLHQGPLHKFSLPVPKCLLFPDIDNWIMFLSRKNVQEFSLRFSYSEDFLLPSHLFKFHDLRHLELLRCKFCPPPNFKAFSKLATLDFQFVTFEPTSFQTFLSSSPLLERVTLKWCTQFDNFIVDAPRLKFFEFYGTTRSYCFKNAPLLEEIIMARACLEISKSFTVDLPEAQLTLHNIKLLNFKFLFLVEWDVYAFYVINNCPNLERLQITFLKSNASNSKDVVERVMHLLRSQGMPHSALKQLKRVDIELSLFSKLDMEFVKYVLSSATVLEIISVATCARFSQWGMAMMEKIKQFPRSSPNVEFIYKDVDHTN